jgi:signal transduction histidine kinase
MSARYAATMPVEALVRLRTSRDGEPLPRATSTSGGPPSAGGPSARGLDEATDRLTWASIWLRAALPGAGFLLLYFGVYEGVERLFLEGASWGTLRFLHIARGAGAAALLATWAFYSVHRLRARVEAALESNVRALEAKVHERARELEAARGFTELLFDSLRERIVVLDRQGRVVKANRMALENAGVPLVGERCMDVFTGCAEQGGCVAEEAFDACGGRGAAGPRVRSDEAGRVWDFETIPVLDASGELTLMLEVGRDVTQQKSLEAQVLHQEKMVGLGVLTAGFAHDLGNPLASLSSELELLEDEDDIGRFRASLAVLRQHVGRVNRTLREMVDFARRRRDAIADVSVGAVVADTARLVCHDPRWKHVALDVDVPPDLPQVRMVEDHLVLVFLNLMLNAGDAMPEGGRLSVSARAVGREVEIRLRDTGVGMPLDVLRHALKPLFTTKGPAGGTGLGLSVCNDVVRAAGGALSLDSIPGEGTEVTIILPASHAEPRQEGEHG